MASLWLERCSTERDGTGTFEVVVVLAEAIGKCCFVVIGPSFPILLLRRNMAKRVRVYPTFIQAIGSPVVLESFESSIDFQQVCTSIAQRKSFSITNRGSRARQIQFFDGSRATNARMVNATQPKFRVKPSEFLLGPQATMKVRNFWR